MADKQKKTSPPYATFPAFMNIINELRETTVPNRIDPSVFRNASGSLIYSVLASLKSLKLINDDGDPAPIFVELVNAADEARPAILKKIVISGYPTLFNNGVDLKAMTAGQFNDHFRSEFEVAGSTIDKIASFFLAAAKAAEIPISKHLEDRTPIASSQSSRKRKKVDSGGADNPPPPPPPIVHEISEKALEYRLVDLMSEASGDPEVMTSIIKVITFLKTKDTQPAAGGTAGADTEGDD